MPRLSSTRLTQKICSEIAAPVTSSKIYRCSGTRGLGLKVTAKGRKTFVFSYSIAGRERRITLGEFGAWTLARAKKRVVELRRLVDQGIDPLAQKEAERKAPTMKSVWSWYTDHFLLKHSQSHKRDLSAAWEKIILPYFGNQTKLQNLSKAGIQAFLDRVTRERGEVTSNRCHSYLRSVLQKAHNDGLLASNPAAGGITRNGEQGRERFLTQKEFADLLAALLSRPDDTSAHAILMIALTGARKGQVLSMRWADINLKEAVWTAPASTTKTKRTHRVFLNSLALKLLKKRAFEAADQPFVFPSHSIAGHLLSVRKTWRSATATANIHNCRIHDLRHTFASFLVSEGKSLEMIGALLGHSQTQTTKRYAHLFDDPLRRASEAIVKYSKG